MHSSAHFDPQLGLDIHLYPWPAPTPHIGMVFDVFDYLPLLGTTVRVNGIRRASAGTGGVAVHIPVAGMWVPPFRAPGGPQIDDELFMGSRTVRVDGESFSRLMMPVLSCNIVGMVPPFRPKRAGKVKPLSLTLPLTVNLALLNNVVVGGPPTVNAMALLMKVGLAALGKGLKRLKKTARHRAFMARFGRFRRTLFRDMKPGFLKCRVLRAEPVDIRSGGVRLEQCDFTLPGRFELAWTRCYASTLSDEEGGCGYGWMTPADTTLEVDTAQGAAVLTQPEGMALFAELPAAPGREAGVSGLPDGGRLWRDGGGWVVEQDDGPALRFEGEEGTLALASVSDHNGNGWRFGRVGGALAHIAEFTRLGDTGRRVAVRSAGGRIRALRFHDGDGGETPLTQYAYDDDGQLSAETDAAGHARRFVYRQRRMTCHEDRNGQCFRYAFDERWRVIHAWGDGGMYDYRFAYHDLLDMVEVTDSLGGAVAHPVRRRGAAGGRDGRAGGHHGVRL